MCFTTCFTTCFTWSLSFRIPNGPAKRQSHEELPPPGCDAAVGMRPGMTSPLKTCSCNRNGNTLRETKKRECGFQMPLTAWNTFLRTWCRKAAGNSNNSSCRGTERWFVELLAGHCSIESNQVAVEHPELKLAATVAVLFRAHGDHLKNLKARES